MGRTVKYMAFLTIALLAGAVFSVANMVPNIRNFELYPVLLVEFEDVKFTVDNPNESFNNLFNAQGYNHNGAYGSVAEYLNSNFRGKRGFSFEISDVISLDNPVEVYGAQSATFNDTDVAQLVKDACKVAMEQGMDFSRYDNDGDGRADNVVVVFAGYAESEGGNPNSIWPHQQAMEQDNLIGENMGIASYTCSSELSGTEGGTISAPGVFCHEFAHFLGLQDLYDVNGEEEGASAALYGSLSIMDRGNLLNSGNTPPYFNAVEREILGICEVEDLLPDRVYTLNPIQDSDVIYRIKTANEGEYFLLECRVEDGWDEKIGGSGLVVYHVDKSNSVYGGLSSSDRWKYNNLNAYAQHECVKVIAALGSGGDVSNVFYPGNGYVINLVSWDGKMPLLDWGGHSVGIGVVDIRFMAGKVVFRTVGDYAFDKNLQSVTGGKVLPFQHDIKVEWDPEIPQDDGLAKQWLVKWRFKDGEQKFLIQSTDSACFWIKDIKPGGDYVIQVSVLQGKLYGVPRVFNASTLPITSIYPYIYVSGKGYRKGEVIDLRVINLVEKWVSLDWYVDGSPVVGESICPQEEGEIEIMAKIKYEDGSEEKIYKRVEIR